MQELVIAGSMCRGVISVGIRGCRVDRQQAIGLGAKSLLGKFAELGEIVHRRAAEQRAFVCVGTGDQAHMGKLARGKQPRWIIRQHHAIHHRHESFAPIRLVAAHIRRADHLDDVGHALRSKRGQIALCFAELLHRYSSIPGLFKMADRVEHSPGALRNYFVEQALSLWH